MTSEERRVLRDALIAQGFDRFRYSDDLDGSGQYKEYWRKDADRVTLSWGPRSG